MKDSSIFFVTLPMAQGDKIRGKTMAHNVDGGAHYIAVVPQREMT
jgi:hypothetical protein